MAHILLMACFAITLPGCVMHETYTTSRVQKNDLADVEGYWHYRLFYDESLQIVSVDGKQKRNDAWLHAYSISLPAGPHWLQLAISRNAGEIARCAFEWDFAAEHRYKITGLHHDQLFLAHPATSPFKAELSVVEDVPAEQSRELSIPATCAQTAICRQESDCPLGHPCKTIAGFDFGTCLPLDH